MVRNEIKVKQKTGLHARPAAKFVKIARAFKSEIILEKDGERADGKSILGVMSLAVARGDTAFLEITGPDEKEAGTALREFLENGGGYKR